jgi:glutamate-1-semialdehyde 2,1-aminomutase
LCDEHDAVLIFDEVMTAFRVSRGCAQHRFGVIPDLTCLGKVVAGGTPAAVYGGRRDLMQQVAPDGPIYQAGTLSGNPLAVAGSLACLSYIEEHPEMYDTLEGMGSQLEAALVTTMRSLDLDGCVQRVGSMLTVFFGPSDVGSWNDVAGMDTSMFGRFFRAALDRDVLLPPSAFESMFLSLAHADVLDSAIQRLTDALAEIA